mmetsp:Transcript_24479/g.48154  ORF Transcript_24479/g.48154 Transcript_24479/m.48154 type:complete len:131 (-) Transcript_24479:662-1054(-)
MALTKSDRDNLDYTIPLSNVIALDPTTVQINSKSEDQCVTTQTAREERLPKKAVAPQKNERVWMCRFLDEIGLEYNTSEIYCDSSSAINWAEDPIQHQRNKHCELKYYIRDRVAKDEVKLFKVHTTRKRS